MLVHHCNTKINKSVQAHQLMPVNPATWEVLGGSRIEASMGKKLARPSLNQKLS
jgi:hypothetical protein